MIMEPTLAGAHDGSVPTSSTGGGLPGPEQLLSELIADYIHDLRSPLVALRGYSKLVLEERTGALNDVQKDHLRIVLDNSNRVVKVLNELAQLAALEPLRVEVIDLSELLAGMIPSWREQLLSQGIPVRASRISPDCSVLGDREKLAQAFAQLFQGIADSVSAPAGINVELSRCGNAVRVTVAATPGGDNAAGDDLVPAVAPGRTRPLSSAEMFVRLHGGQLICHAHPGARAFSVSLPCCPAAMADGSAPVSSTLTDSSAQLAPVGCAPVER